MEVHSIGLGDVAAGSAATHTFKVKNGCAFRVIGDVAGTNVVYRSSDFSVDGSENPFVRTIEAKPMGRILDDSLALQTISNSFKNLGEDIGARPLPLKTALETRVGALVVAIPGTGNTISKQLYIVTPAILGVKLITRDDIEFPPTNETEETLISGKAVTEASGSYGPIASFGIAWNTEGVYEVKWVMRGYGPITKSEDPGKSAAVLYNFLPDEEKEQIQAHLQANPESKLYYINRFYVLDHAEMFIKEAKLLTVSGEFDAANVITGSAVYTFKESKERNAGYGPVVLNYEGMELLKGRMEKAAISRGKSGVFEPYLDKIRGTDIDILLPTGQSRMFRMDQL
jgi:hypothetical protein